MRIKTTIILFFGLCCFLRAQNKSVLSALKRQEIVVGRGGGFAGTETQYRFSEDGMVAKKTGRDTLFRVVRQHPPATFEQWKKWANQLKIKELVHQKTGNVYYFVRYREKIKYYQVSWPEAKAPKGFQAFYRGFMRKIVKDA